MGAAALSPFAGLSANFPKNMKKIATLDEQALMDTVKNAGRPLRLDDILRVMQLSRRLKREVLTALHDFARNGALVRMPGGLWTAAENLKKRRGRLAVQRSGAAFLVPEDEDRRMGGIFLAPDALGDAWNGDIVEVQLLPRRRGIEKKQEGRVLSVLERAHSEIAARVLQSTGKHSVLCRPVDARLFFDVLIEASKLEKRPTPFALLKVRVGEKISGGSRPLWAGEITDSLGQENDASAHELLTKLNHSIPTDFPDNVLAEAEEAAGYPLRAEELEDLRGTALVTIDGEDARDFDDAVFVSRMGQGWRLLVAIADVSYYVRPRTALDREARERGNSYYFPASVEPMLPEALCNGACSLRPGEDRRVLAVDMELDANGSLQKTRFTNALMRSHARLTYRQVQAVLDAPEGKAAVNLEKEAPGVSAMLLEAAELARVLIERRRRQGGLDFDIPEAEFQVEERDGLPQVTGIHNRERLFSHRLIEAFMVRANEAVAEFLSRKKAPFLYRVHPAPGSEKLKELYRSLRLSAARLSLPDPSGISQSSWIAGILDEASAGDASFLVNRMVLRSLMQARYSPEEQGHFGLASAEYCHFTSPIRRYADLVNHRALRYALRLDTGGPLPAGHSLLEIAGQCNARERVAVDAEREIHRRMGCLLLQDRVGERFPGVVSGVMPFGFFVELEGMPVEGMVRVETLGRDFYNYEEDRQELLGAHSGEAFRLGQRVTVKLAGVSTGRLEIDLEYQRDTEEGRRPFRKKKEKKGFRSREERPWKKQGDGDAHSFRPGGRRNRAETWREREETRRSPRHESRRPLRREGEGDGEDSLRRHSRPFRPARQAEDSDQRDRAFSRSFRSRWNKQKEGEKDESRRESLFRPKRRSRYDDNKDAVPQEERRRYRPQTRRDEDVRSRTRSLSHHEEHFTPMPQKEGRKSEKTRKKAFHGAPDDFFSIEIEEKKPVYRFGKRRS